MCEAAGGGWIDRRKDEDICWEAAGRDLKGLVLERTGSHSQTVVSESLWSLSNMQIPGPTPKVLTQQVYGRPEICNLNQLPRGRWPADYILRELLD